MCVSILIELLTNKSQPVRGIQRIYSFPFNHRQSLDLQRTGLSSSGASRDNSRGKGQECSSTHACGLPQNSTWHIHCTPSIYIYIYMFATNTRSEAACCPTCAGRLRWPPAEICSNQFPRSRGAILFSEVASTPSSPCIFKRFNNCDTS